MPAAGGPGNMGNAAMSADPSRVVRDLEPGQRVLIKTGSFAGLQGVVTESRTGGAEPTTVVRIDVKARGRTAPVEFTDPTVDELDRI
jgi:transcription antitermination factor NusG